MAVASGFAACGGSSKREGTGEHRGGSPSTGGAPTGGAGTSAGTATTGGDSSSGSAGVAGNAPSGGNGTGGDAGSSGVGGDAMGGTPAGGVGGANGGVSSGGEGGDGDCVDVCALHGAACCIPNVECVSSDAHCVVEVLAASVPVIYDYATLEERIATLPQELLASITDADVARATAEPAPAGRIELRLTDEAAAAHETALGSPLIHPFRVACNGQSLFVGVTYLEYGAAAIKTPVLHIVSDEESQLILRLGAQQGAWLGLGGGPPDARQRIDRPELRAALCRRGVLDLLQ